MDAMIARLTDGLSRGLWVSSPRCSRYSWPRHGSPTIIAHGPHRHSLSRYTGQAWNIMMGFAGQLSLGHAIYAGLGAYIPAVRYPLRHRAVVGFWRRFRCRLCGAIIGFLAFRFGVAGVYFAILTIALPICPYRFDHLTIVNASAACSCRSRNWRTTICGGCAQSDHVLLRDLAATVMRSSSRVLLRTAWAISAAIREDEQAARAAGIERSAVMTMTKAKHRCARPSAGSRR